MNYRIVMAGVPVVYQSPGSPGAFTQGIADITARSTAEFKKINTLLNICDCYKDAGRESSNPLFESAVEQLFGAMNVGIKGIRLTGRESPDFIINRIKEHVFNNIDYGRIPPKKVCWLQDSEHPKVKSYLERGLQLFYKVPQKDRDVSWKPVKSAKIPDSVIYAFHESGYNPMEVKPNMTIILTPGSYIDPGSRTKVGDITDGSPPAQVWSHYSPITSGTFQALGFPYTKIRDFQGSHTGGGMIINLNMIGDTEQIQIDDDYNVIQGSPDYFLSNQRKNEWLHSYPQNLDADTIKLAQKYILAKELGDTMQVIDAKLFMGLPSGQVCVFTADRVVATRCHELGVPVCLKEYSDKVFADLGRCYYYTPSLDPAKEFENRVISEINSAIKNNENVVNQLQDILLIKQFKLGDNIIVIKEQLTDFFEKVIAGIQNVQMNMLTNVEFISIIKSKSIDEIELICSELRAVQIAKLGTITMTTTNFLFGFWGALEDYKGGKRSYYKSHYVPNAQFDVISTLTGPQGPKETKNLSEILVYYNNIDNPNEQIEFAISRAGRHAKPSAKMQQLLAGRRGGQRGGYTIAELEAAVRRYNIEYYAEEFPLKSPTEHFYDIVYEIVTFIFNSDPEFYKIINYFDDTNDANNEDCIVAISYNFLCLMNLFFNYIGETPTAFEVLMPCISGFMDTYVMNTNLQDFKTLYESIPYVESANAEEAEAQYESQISIRKYLKFMKNITAFPTKKSMILLRRHLMKLDKSTLTQFITMLEENHPEYYELIVRYEDSLVKSLRKMQTMGKLSLRNPLSTRKKYGKSMRKQYTLAPYNRMRAVGGTRKIRRMKRKTRKSS